MSPATGALVALAAFVAMEGVSYLAHRFVMHRVGMAWHRSHHRPPAGPVERNDLFPLCFSSVGVALFALATVGPAVTVLLWVGIGVTAYGAAYLFVHEICIHRRLPVPVPKAAYLEWLRDAHRVHHRFGGEPYGMLLPLVSRSRRARAAEPGAGDPLTRAVPAAAAARASRLRSTRDARMRL